MSVPHMLLTLAFVFWFAASLLFLLAHQKVRQDFTLLDLITGDNGRVSLSKFGQCGAFFTSTWGFVYLTVGDKLTEWYFGAYMLAWAGATLANKAIAAQAGKDS